MNTFYKDWELTDASTLQFVKQLDEHRFEVKEDGMKRRIIDLTLFTREQIESCIEAYGYTIVDDTPNNVYEVYDNGNLIIAECLFESEIFPLPQS